MGSNVVQLKVAVVHADPIVQAGLTAILHGLPEVSVLVRPVGARYDLLVTDYGTGMAALDGRPFAAGERPRVLVVTPRDREAEVRAAMTAGAHGYLLQTCGAEELVEAVHTLGRGARFLCRGVAGLVADSFARQPLTHREMDVLTLLAEGACNKAIARDLGIAVGTVKAHVKAIFDKLDATTRTHAVIRASQRGLVPGSRPFAAPG